MATKLEGGGGGEDKALVVGPLKKELFCGFPYNRQILQHSSINKNIDVQYKCLNTGTVFRNWGGGESGVFLPVKGAVTTQS